MPRKSTGQFRTALGVFLEAWRERNDKQTQSDLQSDLQKTLGIELGKRYVSKVESGQIRSPREDFLRALATLTKVDVAELRQQSREPAPARVLAPHARQTRVLFGHCLWGAPVALAAEQGLLREFLVASLREGRGSSAGTEGEPLWIKTGSVRSGSTPAAGKHYPLSAEAVLDAMRDGRAEIGVVPGDFARRYNDFLLRVGVVFDGVAGIVFLTPEETLQKMRTVQHAQPGRLTPPELTTQDDIGGALSNIVTSSFIASSLSAILDLRRASPSPGKETLFPKPPVIGLDDATMARVVLDDIVNAISASVPRAELPWLKWQVSTRDACDAAWAALVEAPEKESYDLLGMITWEPLGTWIARATNAGGGPKLVAPHVLPLRGTSGWPRHLTFEVVIRRNDAHDRALVRCVEQLMAQLLSVTSTSLASQDGTLGDDAVDVIARYFALWDPTRNEPRLADRRDLQVRLAAYRYITYWYESARMLLKSDKGTP